MPGRAASVGLMYGDVEPGIADGVTRAGEAARVAELGEDCDRGHLADAELAHQRAAAGLAAGIAAQLLIDRRELGLERVDHRDRHRDLLAPGRRQRLAGEP